MYIKKEIKVLSCRSFLFFLTGKIGGQEKRYAPLLDPFSISARRFFRPNQAPLLPYLSRLSF